MKNIEKELIAIGSMSLTELGERWDICFEEPAPPLPLSILRRALAYHLQAQAFGDLAASVDQMLDRLADSPSVPPPEPEIRLKAGTRLLREWNGTVHAVLVLESGFEWSGARYRSLSEIARKITGVQWSGPRFFGVKRRTLPPSQKKLRRG